MCCCSCKVERGRVLLFGGGVCGCGVAGWDALLIDAPCNWSGGCCGLWCVDCGLRCNGLRSSSDEYVVFTGGFGWGVSAADV